MRRPTDLAPRIVPASNGNCQYHFCHSPNSTPKPYFSFSTSKLTTRFQVLAFTVVRTKQRSLPMHRPRYESVGFAVARLTYCDHARMDERRSRGRICGRYECFSGSEGSDPQTDSLHHRERGMRALQFLRDAEHPDRFPRLVFASLPARRRTFARRERRFSHFRDRRLLFPVARRLASGPVFW